MKTIVPGFSSFSRNFGHDALVVRFRSLVEDSAYDTPESISLTQLNALKGPLHRL
jgi:hypothetical protein